MCPLTALLPVLGSEKFFPVRRIYCIGRNYAEHAREMGHDPDREPPFFFQKTRRIFLSAGSLFIHRKHPTCEFELEMIVALKDGGSDIDLANARSCIFRYGVGLDMTRRDLQGKQKSWAVRWMWQKAFQGSLPCSGLVPVDVAGHPRAGAIWLDVNGNAAQRGDLAQMIWSVEEQISKLSGFVTLAAGDLILTGTPAGVGAIARGDRMHGGVEGVGEL